MRLRAKNVVITGGASGIGLATAQRCLEEGARVLIADLDSAKAERAAAELAAKGPCGYFRADVASTADVDALFGHALATLGSVDCVFSNAGIRNPGPVTSCSDEDYARMIDVNLNGVFRVARAALRAMDEQGYGCILNCASVLGGLGIRHAASYCAAKGGVVNLTRALAVEAAENGIRVNCLSPGYIDTPLVRSMPPERLAALARLHPLGRLGLDVEVAHAAVFLMSDEASFITGVNLMVDGGYSSGKP